MTELIMSNDPMAPMSMPMPMKKKARAQAASFSLRRELISHAKPPKPTNAKPQVSMFPSGHVMDKLYKNRVNDARGNND